MEMYKYEKYKVLWEGNYLLPTFDISVSYMCKHSIFTCEGLMLLHLRNGNVKRWQGIKTCTEYFVN